MPGTSLMHLMPNLAMDHVITGLWLPSAAQKARMERFFGPMVAKKGFAPRLFTSRLFSKRFGL